MKNLKKKNFLLTLMAIAIACMVFTVCALAFTNQFSDTPTLKIVAKNLSFSDSIYLKYAVAAENVDNIADIKLLVWTEPQEDYLLGTEDYSLSPQGEATVSGQKCAIFNFKALAAKQMTDVVYCRAYVEKNGTVYYSQPEKYSILQYAYNKLGYTGTPTNNTDLQELLRGMLEYGASAQYYFNYNVDNLATDTYVKVSLNHGNFEDGFSSTLAKPGTKLSVTAPPMSDMGSFAYWTDSEGNIVSRKNSFEITVGDANSTLNAVYVLNQGGNIEGAGATLSEDSFALTEHNIDTSNAIEKTASELQALLASGLDAGSVYRVSGNDPIHIIGTYNFNGATIVANNGIIINGKDITVENLIVIGNVSVVNSQNVTFNSVEIQSESTALSVDTNSANVSVDNCRLISSTLALSNKAFNFSLANSYIEGESAISSIADETTVYNCVMYCTDDAVTVTGADNAVNNNTVTTTPVSVGIVVGEGSLNSLLSYNKIIGAEDSIKIESATNTVVLFNSVFSVSANNNTNTYIVENSLGGKLKLTNNNYLLCDANSYSGTADHTLAVSDNDNTNGDSLMDVTARNEVGAKEELLPHTNKDLFIGMERKSTVKDVANGTNFNLHAYIAENAKKNGVVIVPPGAYSTADGNILTLDESTSNTRIYAFGVYNEHGFLTNAEYLANTNRNNYVINISGANNLEIHGMTIAYDYQALGQAHILEIRDNVDPVLMDTKYGGQTNQYGYEVVIIPSPGFDLDAGWGKSNTDLFSGAYYACDPLGLSPWFSDSYYDYVCTNPDGTITLRIEQSNCENLEVGSILCNRMAGDNQRTISVTNSENVLFKDCVVNGYAAALACVVTGRSYNIKYERIHNCPTAPAVIDELTYNFYKNLEDMYGLDFEMYMDSEGRYRGSAPRFCSVDATHVISGQGLDIESCLFEQMCDDGSNQHGSSSRLYGIKDNGDGTATIYIKGNVTEVYHGIYTSSSSHEKNMTPGTFLAGDNIFIYTPGGEIVCDAICLTGSKDESQLSELYYLGSITYFIHVKSVTVPIESVNFDALEGYDLKENHYRMDNKITVDNISYVSGNFTIDNYVIRNSWSRGVLTKTVNATIKNSTIQNIKSAGILANCEPNWGESTIPRNITVQNCIIDGTGYTDQAWDTPTAAPVYISGLSTHGEANIHKIIVNNIVVDGCHITNYGHQYGIYINGAQNVTITNNVFDPLDSSDPGHFIDITTAVNVEISGNKYVNNTGSLSTISGVVAEDYANIFGTDVEGLFPHDCDIYIAGKHAASFKIVPEDKENIGIAKILSSNLKDVCGYSIASTVMPYANEIKLVVNDSESNLIKSTSYTVKCTEGQLIITAETKASLIYAVEHFVSYVEDLNQQSVYFNEGSTYTFTFNLTNIAASDTGKLKYTGVWNTNGSAMVSGADADYVEFDFTGHSFTVQFNGKAKFDISIDGANAVEYSDTDEMTFILPEGSHTVRILCTDDSEPISFLGIKTYSSKITKPANKEKYVMFIGDSMVDYDLSFAHRVGDILNWDYSVVVGNTLPTTSVIRTPDVFVLFLGTDAITSSSTSDDIKAFKTTYKNLITSITSKYSSAKVYIMQPLSTSDAGNMFNTSHNRYAAINAMKDYSLTGSWDNTSIAWNSKVQIIEKSNKLTDWGIEFDTSTSTTYPTANGDYTVTVNLAKYLLNDVGNSNYINTSFPIGSMKLYSADGTASTITYDKVENGVTFTRYTFGKGGHAWLSGNDYANVSTSVAGRYLVLKYRASGEANLTLELRTNDYGTDKPATQNIDGKRVVWISGVTMSENNVPEDWEIAIVDLSQFEHYTVGLENTKVQLRISTESDTLDIAYAAILDDLSEARMAAMFELNATQYRFYDDWSKPGVDVSLNGEEIEAPIDLSFVNQEFGILGMGVYNGTKTLFVNTKEGVDFARFNFNNGQGHVFLHGTNNFVEITGDTGRYFIIKYRSTNNTYISFNALTSDYPHSSTGSHMATQTKPAANINSGVWETAVIDLSTFINGTNGQYTTDADLAVWLRFTTGVTEIDISYMAIVDDLDEANTFIKYKGDSSFVHYTNWSTTGTTVTVE